MFEREILQDPLINTGTRNFTLEHVTAAAVSGFNDMADQCRFSFL